MLMCPYWLASNRGDGSKHGMQNMNMSTLCACESVSQGQRVTCCHIWLILDSVNPKYSSTDVYR